MSVQRRIALMGIPAFLLCVGFYVGTFWPRTIHFSYSGDNCYQQTTLFPKAMRISGEKMYSLEFTDSVEIFGQTVAAKGVCVSARQAPVEGEYETISVKLFGFVLGSKSYRVKADPAPVVSLASLNAPIPATRPVRLSLSSSDTLHTYELKANDKIVQCKPVENSVLCDIAELGLSQGESAELTVQRSFDGSDTEVIDTIAVDILSATSVVSSSVSNGQVIYDSPTNFTIEFDKPIDTTKVALEKKTNDTTEAVGQSTTAEGVVVSLVLVNALDRSASYILTVGGVTAVDGSALNEPYTIDFSVSGGPEVTKSSIGTYNTDPGAAIVLTFDQPIKEGQDLATFIRTDGIRSIVTQIDNTSVRVQLQDGGRCQPFTVVVDKGLASQHDIVSTSDWSQTSRTRCSTSEVIGYSVQGRPITAYYYGNGSTTYLFTGAIHGNELSSTYTMNNWMNDLEANPGKIPTGVQVVVVPVVSPDGVASASRLNVNGVNLNRNFPTWNWVSNVMTSGGEQAGGGGASAGSEPETKALMNLTNRLTPRLVITHHSAGYLVNSNDVGISISAGQEYARLARYSFVPNSATTNTFGFEMTGTYEDWLLERGTAATLIELDSDRGNHYARNQNAMWKMLGY